jgi:hypothetical protein
MINRLYFERLEPRLVPAAMSPACELVEAALLRAALPNNAVPQILDRKGAAMSEPKPGDKFWIEFTCSYCDEALVDGYPTGERVVNTECHRRFILGARVVQPPDCGEIDVLIETISDCAACDGTLRGQLNAALARVRQLLTTSAMGTPPSPS